MLHRILVLLLTLSLVACGSGAIITARDGRYEGTITGHDGGHVFIDGQPIDRTAITDIDHPGNVAAIIGSIVAAVGALSAIPNCSRDSRAESDTPCASSGLWMLTGIPVAIYGLITHSSSVSAAGD